MPHNLKIKKAVKLSTTILNADENGIKIAAQHLKEGELVAIPTETVYGLAADAMNEKAVAKIFVAKGRPQDNPLIVHIAKLEDVAKLAKSVPQKAKLLMDKFCPGPLTVILPKADNVPDIVTAGLQSVAIRMPSHPVARAIIEKSGCMLAAPSANLSGSPSPTSAEHVYNDLNGRIKYIVDGKECSVGLESTVVSVLDSKVRLLRPGAVTVEMLESVVGEIAVDEAVLAKLKDNEKVMSPGLKYKHYSPKCKVVVVHGDLEKFKQTVEQKAKEYDGGVFVMCFDGEEDCFLLPCVTYGAKDDDKEQAKRLFGALRKLDEEGAKVVFARAPKQDGVGLAVYNRLLRAAGFDVIF